MGTAVPGRVRPFRPQSASFAIQPQLEAPLVKNSQTVAITGVVPVEKAPPVAAESSTRGGGRQRYPG
jgi:hypothetical protein